MRVFAGPNGSGKTTIIQALRNNGESLKRKIPLGVYVNADDIELVLSKTRKFSFRSLKVSCQSKEFLSFYAGHPLSLKTDIPAEQLTMIRNVLSFPKKSTINSYIAAIIADFVRRKLLKKGISFSFETVMSHASKVEIMQHARNLGYRVYLYFVATEDPQINIGRVRQRSELGGHNVGEVQIKKRYYNSLDLMLDGVKLSHRAYIFDNSGIRYEMVAEVTDGKQVNVVNPERAVPDWFYRYFYLKASNKKL